MPARREKNLLDNFNVALHRHIAHRLGGDEDKLLPDRASGGDDLSQIGQLWVVTCDILELLTSILILTSLLTLSMNTSLGRISMSLCYGG